MDPFIAEWLNILVRWGHLVAGIAWIGTSFYFVALDLSLRKAADMPAGVSGEAWEVHGGGFYHVRKYLSAPLELPPDLIWKKVTITFDNEDNGTNFVRWLPPAEFIESVERSRAARGAAQLCA